MALHLQTPRALLRRFPREATAAARSFLPVFSWPSSVALGFTFGQAIYARRELNSITRRNDQLGAWVGPEENDIVTVRKIGKIPWGKTPSALEDSQGRMLSPGVPGASPPSCPLGEFALSLSFSLLSSSFHFSPKVNFTVRVNMCHQPQIPASKSSHVCTYLNVFCVTAWLSAPAEDWCVELWETLVSLLIKFQGDQNLSLLAFFTSRFLNHPQK